MVENASQPQVMAEENVVRGFTGTEHGPWVPVGVTADLNSARFRYAVKLVLEGVLGCRCRIYDEEAAWAGAPGEVGVLYGDATRWRDVAGRRGVRVAAAGLLTDGSALPRQGLEAWNWTAEGYPFAAGEQGECDFFAWAFWTAVRCEELLPGAQSGEARDAHGRFRARASEQVRYGWIEAPVLEQGVRAWAQQWGWEPPLDRSFQVVPTIDVDSALMYRGKGWGRTLGGALRQVMRGDWQGVQERVSVLRGRQEDAYDTYDAIAQLHLSVGWAGRWFLLVADRGPYDRGMHWQSQGLREVATRLAALPGPGGAFSVGVHPGHASHADADRIRREKMRVELLTGQEVVHARQHYLLQRLPEAWEALEAAGSREDHSMGCADHVGLRTGLARPYPAYSIRGEREMNLWIHPVHVMEATLARYMGRSPDAQTLGEVLRIAHALRAVDGVFVSLWHNETAVDRAPWTGWWTFYQQMLHALSRPTSGRILEP